MRPKCLSLCQTNALTGPVCSLKPVSMAPVRGLKELLHTGGFSMRERRELLSWMPGLSIIPGSQEGQKQCRNPHLVLSYIMYTTVTKLPQNLQWKTRVPTRKLRKKVAEFLLHLLPTELVVSMLQVVMRDEISVSCQLIFHCEDDMRGLTKVINKVENHKQLLILNYWLIHYYYKICSGNFFCFWTNTKIQIRISDVKCKMWISVHNNLTYFFIFTYCDILHNFTIIHIFVFFACHV